MSIHSKIDELRTNCVFLHQYREVCWHGYMITSTVDAPNFTIIRSDRTGDSSKTKGGVKLKINNNCCNIITITSTLCDSTIKCLTVNLQPFYLPREVTNICITVLHIPTSVNKAAAIEYVDNLCSNVVNEKPAVPPIILDMNRCKL